jgi:16S rRNA (guanine1207-N2)-methyltransferase
MSSDAPIGDAYFKKRLDYRLNNRLFHFDVGHTLFSSHQIDDGSDLFLRTIEQFEPAPQRILDLGCGCGVLGICLAAQYPQAAVELVDKDLLAVRYARHNAQLNQIGNIRVQGSIGLDDLPDGTYDLIISNIPAKIGDAAIESEFFLAPLRRLSPGGVYWFVVVSALNHLIPRLGPKHGIKVKEVKKRAGYSVYRVEAPAADSRSS